MTRRFKTIGLTLVAVFAMSAVTAAGAQAVSFHSEVQTTYYKGEQSVQNVLTTTAGNLKCKKATFSGEVTATGGSGSNWTRGTIEVTPTYSECTAFGQSAQVTTTGCLYVITAIGDLTEIKNCDNETITGDSTTTYGGIIVHLIPGLCIEIPNQHTGAPVDHSNGGAGASRDVTTTPTITNKIDYSVVGPGGICGAAGTYNNEGSYTGSITIKGYKNIGLTEQVGVWVE